MAKITRAAIDALDFGAARAGPQFFYLWDSELPGFGVRCTSAGVKSYVLRYRHGGRQRIMTLGRCGVLEVAAARAQAKERLAALYAGKDPFAGSGPITTLRELADAHQRGRKAELKPKTWAGYESLWNAHIIPCIGSSAVDALSDEDVNRLRKRLAKNKATFNRCMALVITALRWHGLPTDNHPFRKARRFKEGGRDRILSEDENQRLYAAFDDYKRHRKPGWRYVDLFALLLLTALRRDEWRLGRWEWVRWSDETYVLPDNKTGGRVVYLPQRALVILQALWKAAGRPKSGFIFPSAGTKRKAISWTWRQWDAMRRGLQIDGFTVHDMRRTAGSYAHEKGGLSQRQVGDLLGHKRMETTSRYIHDKEKKAGANAAAEAVAASWENSGFSKPQNGVTIPKGP